MRWNTKYSNLIFKSSTLDELQNLIATRFPVSLYKYRFFDQKFYWKEWVKGEIFLSLPQTFNDPYDCSFHYNFGNDNCYRQELGITKENEPYSNNDDNSESLLKDKFRVACFSECNNSILMWSHYADNHKGFCLEYRLERPENMSGHVFPVLYSNTIPIIHSISHQIPPNNIQWLRPFLCKAKVWKYENEWRYIAESSSNSQNITLLPSTIYLGAKVEDSNKTSLQEFIRQEDLDIKICEMHMSKKAYVLNSSGAQ